MNRFKERSALSELIDAPGIPFSDWEVCLKELNTVNTLLGGHAITIEGVKRLIRKHDNKKITIAEIGCGGGDNLKAIHKWNSQGKYNIHYIGIDLNKACTEFATTNCNNLPSSEFICSDYRDAQFNGHKPDIIFNSLFCHHFNNTQMLEMLKWMNHNSTAGFFINDLQRHPLAYHSISILTKCFSQSYLVKNDAPISVLRGFHKEEWKQLLQKASLSNYTINWRWAFRYLVTVYNA